MILEAVQSPDSAASVGARPKGRGSVGPRRIRNTIVGTRYSRRKENPGETNGGNGASEHCARPRKLAGPGESHPGIVQKEAELMTHPRGVGWTVLHDARTPELEDGHAIAVNRIRDTRALLGWTSS